MTLTYDRRREDWFWDPHPSPPTDDREIWTVSFADGGGGASSGAVIRVSTQLGGTYAFDTVRRSWRREGAWTLPFEGRAQYVADYGLWFGFSDSDRGGFGRAILFIARVAAGHRVAEAEKHRSRYGVPLSCSAVPYTGRGIDFFFLFIRLI